MAICGTPQVKKEFKGTRNFSMSLNSMANYGSQSHVDDTLKTVGSADLYDEAMLGLKDYALFSAYLALNNGFKEGLDLLQVS